MYLSELLVTGDVQENKAVSECYMRGILMEKDLTPKL